MVAAGAGQAAVVAASEVSFLARLADPGAPAADLTARAAAVRDWGELVEQANTHGLLPLLNRWMAREHAPGVPPEIARDVRMRAQALALGGLRITGELISLTRILDAAGIPAIALKGPALAMRAYGDVALRPQQDVDILVHERDVTRALAALAPGGYQPVKALAAGQEAAFREVEYHHALAGPSGISVELHWGIIKRQFGLRVAESLWWTDPHLVTLGGTEVRALSNEATLVYLAIHGAKHEWHHLRWIGDIAGVARLAPMDWGRVADTSARLGTMRMTRLALALAAEMLGAELPEAAMRIARGDRVTPLLIPAVRARVATEDAPGFVESTRFQLRARERLRDKIAFAFRHAVTPNIDDLATAELPVAWRGLYVILRPIRLLRKWLGLGTRAVRSP